MARNTDAQMRADDVLDEVGDEPRVYELGFHLNPELPSEEVKKAYRAIRDDIEAKGALVAEGEPQKIPLAYTISRPGASDAPGRRDFDSAYFSWIVYETSPARHAEIISAVSSNIDVIRFIDLITTKDAARHAAEMREISMKTPEHEDDPDAVANSELDVALENVVV